MAILYATVWEDAEEVALGSPLQYLSKDFTAGMVTTDPINSDKRKRKRVRIFSDTDCFVSWGESPTVTDGSDGTPMGAENPEYFDIESGHKIAVIAR